MTYVEVECFLCKKTFLKELRRFNESKKRRWNFFCSPACYSKARSKQKLLKCSNPKCENTFKRAPRELRKSKSSYCSRSCAITVNNSKFPKRPGVRKKCHCCGKEFVSRERYCSKECKNKDQVISKKEIIRQIREFYKKEKRIPFKQEFRSYHAAQRSFGNWNRTVKAAGFEPNPVKFAKKYIASDGHKCDSLAEKIIDDWLSARGILHEINVPYHKNNMTADFKVNGILIEFFGLHGEHEDYDRLVGKKKELWKKRKLKVIEIYPKHLFPKNRLNQILKF